MAQSSNTTGAVEVLHMIGALKQLLPHLSAKAIGRILPHLGMLHELQQPLLTRTVLDTLQALCMSPSADIPAASLGEILGRLGSLLSSGERRNSVDEVTVISHVIQHGFDRLHGADHHLCVTKLPAVFHSLAGMLGKFWEVLVALGVGSLCEWCPEKKFQASATAIEKLQSITVALSLPWVFCSCYLNQFVHVHVTVSPKVLAVESMCNEVCNQFWKKANISGLCTWSSFGEFQFVDTSRV